MKIPYCKTCRKWSFKSHTHGFTITYSLGAGTDTQRTFKVFADTEKEALDKGRLSYLNEFYSTDEGRKKIKIIFHEKGLAGGYLPYYFVHSVERIEGGG